MINRFLLSLYDYYRRKNDSFSAVFHTKALFSLFLLMLLTIGFFLVSAMLDLKVSFNGSSMQRTNLKVTVFAVLVFIWILVWFFTDSYKVLESHRNHSEVKYRKYFFISFYIAIPVLVYLIAVNK